MILIDEYLWTLIMHGMNFNTKFSHSLCILVKNNLESENEKLSNTWRN